MKKSIFLTTTLLISSGLTLNFYDQSFSAEVCTPLKVVGGEEGQILLKKTVSAPKIPIGVASLKRDNWNTDFAVGSNVQYKRYIATLTPLTEGTYSIRMFLKYSDTKADEVYNNKPQLTAGKPLVISDTPDGSEQPYQINLFVGDAESIAKTYTISIKACK